MPRNLLCHVVECAINVCALAKVCDRVDVAEELITVSNPAEDPVVLGEMEAPHGPCELDPIGVGLVIQPHRKILGEFLNAFHNTPRGVLQQGY